MARVTVEDCIEQIPNRFDLVLKAAHLAREINGGLYMVEDQSKIEKKDREKSTVLALREIGDRRVSNEIIEKRFILNTIRNTYGVEVGLLPQYDSQNHQLSHFASAKADGAVEIDGVGEADSNSKTVQNEDSLSSGQPVGMKIDEQSQPSDLDQKDKQLAIDDHPKDNKPFDGDNDPDVDDELELKNSPLATLYSDKQSSKSENVEKYDSKFEDINDD